ncbi:hypothetical protein L0Y59_02250 [Candidatus Uhrbacteria bacterium]|nr:hypothetical protein [Candidatus Uhrbacteria bacterium]
MPPSADQVVNVKNILQAYRSQVRTIVERHKTTVQQAVADGERRKIAGIRKTIGKKR